MRLTMRDEGILLVEWVVSDIRQGRLSLYGHYILTSSARAFSFQGVTHTVQGGIRYSLGSSREDISDKH